MKKRYIKYASLFSVVFLLISCSTAQVEVDPFETSRTYLSDYDTQWKKMVRFFSTNTISIGTLEKESGIITVNSMNLNPQTIGEYCLYTVPFLQNLSGGSVTGSATLVEDDEFVTANVNFAMNVTFSSCNMYGQCFYTTQACVSNGSLERSLLDALN